ncbi:MAG: GerMN domain-containing protein [Actinomycetota bacterium]
MKRATARGVSRASGLVACGALTLGCGVPTGDGTFEQIATEEIAPALAAPATTTTTTTTTTTIPDAVETTVVPPTTMAPGTFETLEIYFVSRTLLRPVELVVPSPVVSTDLIEALETGPPESTTNIDTAVPEGLVNGVDVLGGVVTIDLDEAEFDSIPRRFEQTAIAQLVFTFVLNLSGVGQAQFTIDGRPTAVPRGDNRLIAEPVSIDDYLELLADAPAVPETTTTTTTTTIDTTTPATSNATATGSAVDPSNTDPANDDADP